MAGLSLPVRASAPLIEYPDLDSLIITSQSYLIATPNPNAPFFAKFATVGDLIGQDDKLSIGLKRLASCESSLNPEARGDNNTSFGLFQFKRITWKENCEGSIWSIEDQVDCVLKLTEEGQGKDRWKRCWKKENLEEYF